MQEPIDTLEDASRSDDKSSFPIQEHYKKATPESLSQFLNHPQLRTEIRRIVQKEVRYIYVFVMDKSFLKAAEDAL